MTKTTHPTSSLLSRMAINRRASAFCATTLAVFVIGCLIWPLTVTSFRSVAVINVAGESGEDAKSNFEQRVAELVKEETSNERIEAIVSQIDTGTIRSKQIEFRDHESIRKALLVGVTDNSEGFEFLVGYDGKGSEDEKQLVNLLTARIAHRLHPNPNSPLGRQLSSEFAELDPLSIENFKEAQNQSIDQATWLVDQIETDLNAVKTSLGQIGTTSMAQLPMGEIQFDEEPQQEASPFKYASSKRVSTDVGALSNSLNSIDVQALRSTLTDIRSRLDVQTDMLSQRVGRTNFSDQADLTVSGMEASKTQPVNGSPGAAAVFLLGLTALMIGATVAFNMDPFAERGFEDTSSISSRLGIPVVAKLTSMPSDSKPDEHKTSWANRVANIAGLCLFGILIVVAGFVLTNSEVRESFFENPLFGCAKIFRIFAGY